MSIFYTLNAVFLILNLIFLQKFLHIYQLKDYNNTRYFKYFFDKKIIFYLLIFIVFMVQLFVNNLIFYTVTNVGIFIISIIFYPHLIKANKTPLHLTGKIKRLFIISTIILVCTSFIKVGFCLISFMSLLSPILANITNIYDKIKNHRYIKSAQNKLKIYAPKIIAITGSNGKTSVKNILLQMLKTKYKTIASPASYNTPLGISKFLNEELTKDHEYIILEYGARHKKDVKKLCRTFGADYGILTTIAPQHLESFHNIENIYLTKNELVKYLQNKLCIFNIDNIYCRRSYLEKEGEKISVSIHEKADIFAKNLKISSINMKFNMFFNQFNKKITTNLLGRHNITNILLASALALHLNIDIEEIAKTISSLQPTEHRLQLIKSRINIIDDSYNCSLASAEEALYTLSHFEGKKMIATPGIIECGNMSYEINFRLGVMMKNFDYIIVIGKQNKKAILDGLKTQKFDDKKILLAENLESSKKYFSLLADGDTLLLLNDLPDDYH